jgi:hypothetical protein
MDKVQKSGNSELNSCLYRSFGVVSCSPIEELDVVWPVDDRYCKRVVPSSQQASKIFMALS